MSILKVARMGHPVLRSRARQVEPSELKHPHFQKLVDDMIETMHEYHGVGLAGPQVHEDFRIFVALLDDDAGEKSEAVAVINPVIVPNVQTTAEGWEGCLSIPDIRGMVPRFTDITVRALDRRGKAVEIPLKNFAARVVQHETDHLDGILFFDRMTSMTSLTYLDEYSRYHAKGDDEGA
jgi:peptide deformylase